MTTPTVVLVHGAFHGSWCFELIRPLLHEHGIRTEAPELRFETLAGDAAIVTETLDTLDGPAVLLGHSYGGTVITWAGEHTAVRSLVYLTAGVPDVGEGVGSGPTTRGQPILQGFTMGEDGAVTVEPIHAVQLFYPDADPVTAAAWAARLRPGRTFASEAVPHAAWRTRPVDYVVCRDDAVLPAGTQRWYAEQAGATVHELPGDHSPFLARPRALVELLVQIVGSSPSNRPR